MKRCIFHYPQPILDDPNIGSALRPNRMRAAFEQIGYQVDEVTGYGAERKRKIQKIRENIKKGIEYDFVYSESINSPMLLAEADHLPRHPFMDFSFFRFCRHHNIPVGLFYRDMHWAFPLYKQAVSFAKRLLLIPMFRYDLQQYKRSVDIVYAPSEPVCHLLPDLQTDVLPPGGTTDSQWLNERFAHQPVSGQLHIFYVGNVTGGVYDLVDFCQAVKQTHDVYLTICAPQDAWEQAQERYAPALCDRITVIHKAAKDLDAYYQQSDVFCACLQVNAYSAIAMPIKVFESIGRGVPVLISSGIAAAACIEKEDCGWCVENSIDSYCAILKTLRDNPEEIMRKTKNTVRLAPNHTWSARAQKVADDLTALKNKEKRK